MKEGKWGRNLYFNIFQTLLLFEYSFVFFLTFFLIILCVFWRDVIVGMVCLME